MPNAKVMTLEEEVNIQAEAGLILVEDTPAVVCETCDDQGVVSRLTYHGEEEFTCSDCNPPGWDR